MKKSYGTREVNEHDVSTTGEVNVVRQHKYPITSTENLPPRLLVE